MSNLHSSLNGSASNLPDGSGRSFAASYSGQSGAPSPSFHHIGNLLGLHNIHGSYNVGNMQGTLSSRNSSMNSISSAVVYHLPGYNNLMGVFPVEDLLQITFMSLSLSCLMVALMGVARLKKKRLNCCGSNDVVLLNSIHV